MTAQVRDEHRTAADDALPALVEARRPRGISEPTVLPVDERMREALAQIIADAELRGAEAALAPFHALFAGDPDTPCRTTWRSDSGYGGRDTVRTECVEVPLDEVRATFDEAERAVGGEA